MSRESWFGLLTLLIGVFLVLWAVGDALTGYRDLLLVVGVILISMGDTWGLERLRRDQQELARRLSMLEKRDRGWPESGEFPPGS